jgi:hypothetical protein
MDELAEAYERRELRRERRRRLRTGVRRVCRNPECRWEGRTVVLHGEASLWPCLGCGQPYDLGRQPRA